MQGAWGGLGLGVAAAMVAFPAAALAAPAAPVASASPRPSLGPDATVALALAQAPAARAAALGEEAANIRLARARGAWWPSLRGSASVAQTTQINAAQVTTAPFLLGNASLALRQPLWDGGRLSAALNQAEAAAALASAERRRVQVALAQAVRRAQARLAEAEGLVGVARRNLSLAEGQQRLVAGLVAQGQRAALDGVRASLSVQAARVELGAVSAEAQGAQAGLAEAAGMTLPLNGALPAEANPLALTPLPRLQAWARWHPGLLAALAREASAEAQRRAAGAERLPDLAVDASTGVRVRDGEPLPSYQVSLGGNWGLWNGTADGRLEGAAASDRAAAEATRVGLGASVAAGLARAEANWQAALARRAGAKLTARDAEALAEAAAARYRAGLGLLVEWTEAENARAQAAAASVRAEAAYHVAAADRLAAAGLHGLESPQDLSALEGPLP